jgi:Holliday junction resolvase RusA-like endonuclease
MKFDIPGRFPGMNEIITAAKMGRGKYQPYAKMKEEYTNMVAWLAKKLPRYKKVDISIVWYEPNARRDLDNIMSGQKFIMDGLVKAGAIPDDSQKYVKSVTHKFGIDRVNPRIEVELRKEKQEK